MKAFLFIFFVSGFLSSLDASVEFASRFEVFEKKPVSSEKQARERLKQKLDGASQDLINELAEGWASTNPRAWSGSVNINEPEPLYKNILFRRIVESIYKTSQLDIQHEYKSLKIKNIELLLLESSLAPDEIARRRNFDSSASGLERYNVIAGWALKETASGQRCAIPVFGQRVNEFLYLRSSFVTRDRTPVNEENYENHIEKLKDQAKSSNEYTYFVRNEGNAAGIVLAIEESNDCLLVSSDMESQIIVGGWNHLTDWQNEIMLPLLTINASDGRNYAATQSSRFLKFRRGSHADCAFPDSFYDPAVGYEVQGQWVFSSVSYRSAESSSDSKLVRPNLYGAVENIKDLPKGSSKLSSDEFKNLFIHSNLSALEPKSALIFFGPIDLEGDHELSFAFKGFAAAQASPLETLNFRFILIK